MKIRRFAIFWFAIALFLFIQSVPVTSCYAVTVEAGDRAPLFEAQTLDGDKFVLKEHLGKKVVLLNFWSVF